MSAPALSSSSLTLERKVFYLMQAGLALLYRATLTQSPCPPGEELRCLTVRPLWIQAFVGAQSSSGGC